MEGAEEYGEAAEIAMRQFVATLPKSLHEHADDFAELRMTVEAVEMFVAAAKRSGHAWWTDAIDESAQQTIEAGVDRHQYVSAVVSGKQHVTHMRMKLTEKQRTALRMEYASVTELSFEMAGRGEPVEHAMANAARSIANVQLRRLVPRGHRILEVGAKIEHVVNAGPEPGRYMACVPVLDHHDVMRRSSQEQHLRVMMRRRGPGALKPAQRAVAELYFRDKPQMFSEQRIQDVRWQTDCILSIDANYDVPMTDIPRVMRHCGARMWIGSMVRCPQAAIYFGRASGYMPLTEFEWSADAERDSIVFNFRSSSRPYKHVLSVYREYMVYTRRVMRHKGRQYVFTVLPSSVPSQLFFSVYEVPDREYGDTTEAFVPTGKLGMIRVDTVSAVLQPSGDRVVPDSFEVSEDQFSRMLQDRMLLGLSVDVSEVYRSVRGARVGFVVNGVRLATDNPLCVDLLKSMVVVIDTFASEMLRRGQKEAAEAIRLVKTGGVKHMGLWSTLWDSLWSAKVGPGALVSVVRQRVLQLTEGSAETGLQVTRLPAFERVAGAVVEVVGGDDNVVERELCLCQELAEARAIYAGMRGGLSADEQVSVARYVQALKRQVCARCALDVKDAAEQGLMSSHTLKPAAPDKASEADSLLSGSDTEVESEDLFEDASSTVSSDDVEAIDRSAELTAQRIVHLGQPQSLDAEGPVRDALGEYVEILERQMSAADSKAQEWARVLLRTGICAETLEGASDTRLSHHVLEVAKGYVVGIIGRGAEPQEFRRVYDFKQRLFYDVQKLPNRQSILPQRCSSQVYVHSDYLVWNQPRLMKFAMALLWRSNIGPMPRKLRFVNGVYGCGKTREITQGFRAGDMYMSTTRASVNEVRKKLFGSAPEGKRAVVTYDSAAVNGLQRRVKRLFLDEMPMSHWAEVSGLMATTEYEEVVGYGDFSQVPYISFVANFNMLYASGVDCCEVEYRNITHRCRLSVAAAVRSFYPDDVKLGVCQCCEHIRESEEGFELKHISSIHQVPLRRGVKYLTFTHREQGELQQLLDMSRAYEEGPDEVVDDVGDLGSGFAEVSTAAQIQGSTYREVAIVRCVTTSRPDSIYFDIRQVLVALTRAKIKVTYYTAAAEADAVVLAYRRSCDEECRDEIRRNSRGLS